LAGCEERNGWWNLCGRQQYFIGGYCSATTLSIHCRYKARKRWAMGADDLYFQQPLASPVPACWLPNQDLFSLLKRQKIPRTSRTKIRRTEKIIVGDVMRREVRRCAPQSRHPSYDGRIFAKKKGILRSGIGFFPFFASIRTTLSTTTATRAYHRCHTVPVVVAFRVPFECLDTVAMKIVQCQSDED
jgi:hypothetical protein